MNPSPILIPIVACVAGCAMIVAILAIIFWSKTRSRELEVHREMRLREIEHERNLKQMELEAEKLRSARASGKTV